MTNVENVFEEDIELTEDTIPHIRAWGNCEKDILKTYCKTHTDSELVGLIHDKCGRHRTVDAVRNKRHYLGHVRQVGRPKKQQ